MRLKKQMIWLLVFALLASWLLPREVAAYAAPTRFTYAEQKTGVQVKDLTIEPKEQVDLKFIGIKNYNKYKLSWTSSNEKVATVDQKGVITAKAVGTATIRLNVGNGADYISDGVVVTVVAARETVTIGTSKSTANSPVTLSLEATVDLNYYGVTGWSAKRYVCQWDSTRKDIATVNQSGIVTPRKEGTTVITLSITDNFTAKQLSVRPVAVTVGNSAQPTPWPFVTPQTTPTPWPFVTPQTTPSPWPFVTPQLTPTPMPWPFVTPQTTPSPWPYVTPQLTPSPVAGGYTVTLESASSIVLEFPSAVSYGKGDIRLYRIFKSGSQNVEYDWGIKSVTSGVGGTKLTVEAENGFSNGDTYIVKVGTNDKGTEFAVSFGAPDRIAVTYECLGAEGVAYAQTSVNAPVTLSCRLYHGSLDVTKEYASSGYVEYEMLSPVDSYTTHLIGNELTFYEEKTTAVIRAVFHYGTAYNTKLTSAPVSIVSQPLGSYTLKSVEKWTIIDDTKRAAIDWGKPVHEVTAGAKNQKLVVLFSDKYGIRYSTDPRGVDEEQGIYSMDDTDKLFAANGASIGFTSVSMDKLWVDDTGAIDPYVAATNAVVYVMSYNYQQNNSKEVRIGTLGIKVLKEAELASIDAATKTVSLTSKAISGFEDLCKTQVKINAFDQYGKPWEGDCFLDLSCTTNEVNAALGSSSGPAYLDGTTLYIDAEAIGALTNRTTVSFIVTEPILKKKTTVTVQLKTPSDKDGNIVVNGWEIGTEDVSLSFSKEDTGSTKYATVGLYQLSKSTIRVGLYGKERQAQVTLTAEKTFTPTTGEVDDCFVLITGLGGKAVQIADSPDKCGVYWDAESCTIHVIAAAPSAENKTVLDTLDPGKYTVKVMKITAILNNGTRTYATKTATFTIVDDRPKIAVRDTKGIKSATYVSSKTDSGSVISIIEELFTFTKDGVVWEDWTANMITDVVFVWSARTVQIKSIDFLVPVREGSDLSYKVTLKGIGRTIQYGVSD